MCGCVCARVRGVGVFGGFGELWGIGGRGGCRGGLKGESKGGVGGRERGHEGGLGRGL